MQQGQAQELVVVAITVGNDWSTVAVILGLLLVGIGEGTLFLIVGAISVLAIFPASRLPRYVPGELPAEDIVSEAGPGEREAGSPA